MVTQRCQDSGMALFYWRKRSFTRWQAYCIETVERVDPTWSPDAGLSHFDTI